MGKAAIASHLRKRDLAQGCSLVFDLPQGYSLVFALVETTSVSLVVDTRVASHLTIHQYATLMSPN